MRKLAEDNEEDDKARNPRIKLVSVHNLVTKQRHDERCGRDDDDSGIARYAGIDGVDELRADNDVDGRPADAGKAVEESDDLDAVVAEEKAGQHHLAQAEDGAKGAIEADRQDAEEVDEEDREDAVGKAEAEDRNAEGADGEGGDDHVGG